MRADRVMPGRVRAAVIDAERIGLGHDAGHGGSEFVLLPAFHDHGAADAGAIEGCGLRRSVKSHQTAPAMSAASSLTDANFVLMA